MEEVDVAVEYICDQSGIGCVSTAGYGVWGCVFTAGYGVVCSQLGMGLCVHSWVWVDRWSYL